VLGPVGPDALIRRIAPPAGTKPYVSLHENHVFAPSLLQRLPLTMCFASKPWQPSWPPPGPMETGASNVTPQALRVLAGAAVAAAANSEASSASMSSTTRPRGVEAS
jgi:hypothetical protein